jgi:hypothetical protein
MWEPRVFFINRLARRERKRELGQVDRRGGGPQAHATEGNASSHVRLLTELDGSIYLQKAPYPKRLLVRHLCAGRIQNPSHRPLRF